MLVEAVNEKTMLQLNMITDNVFIHMIGCSLKLQMTKLVFQWKPLNVITDNVITYKVIIQVL